MKIKVEVEVPKGRHCGGKDCVFCNTDDFPFYCDLFRFELWEEDKKGDIKCPACLAACKEAEEKSSL